MSYKKIEDIDYLYNNIQEELDESLKHSLGVLYEEMQDSGYSDSAITSYFETVDIFELNEKLELLSENPIKNPNNWKRAWDIIRARGSLVKRQVGNIIKRNTPVKTRINVKNNINSTKDKVSSTIQKGKDLIKNNPKKSSAAGLSALGLATAATNSSGNTNNDKKGENRLGLDGSINVPGLSKTIKTREGGNNVKNNNVKVDDKNDPIKNQVDKYVADRQNPDGINRDLTIDKSEEGKAKYAAKAAKRQSEIASKDEKAAHEWGENPDGTNKKQASASAQISAYQKGRPSPASFNTNQRQTRELVKQQSKQVYPSITDKDLNQFSRSKTYTAADGKTQVDRSTVFTKAKFDFGNIKKGQELGVMGKKQRQQYDLKAASFKEDFDAFDIVLGYLVETEQVDSLDEALYIMMEMDAVTIQSIVKDFELLAEEAADKVKDDRLVKYGIGHDGSDKKGGSGGSSDSKRPKGKTPLQKESEKKYGKGKTAVDIVRAKIEKEHGKGAIAPSKKKKK